MEYVNAAGRVLRTSASSTSWIGGEQGRPGVVVGTSANETLTGYDGDVLRGGTGDDIYGMAGAAVVVEQAGEGIDTVSAWSSYVLPDHVENLVMNGGYGWYGIGNDLDNIIVGTGGAQQIDGGEGDDVLIGGGGDDLFVISAGAGSDVILDFGAGGDQIRLGGYGLSRFEEVLGLARQSGADTVISLPNGERLVLRDVALGDLRADDFLLDVDRDALRLTFADEFDAVSLAADGGFWRTAYGYMSADTVGSRSMNDESQVYMDPRFAGTGARPLGVNPFSVDAGVLTITAAPVTPDVAPWVDGRAYTSGLLTSQGAFAQLYGYFEIRAALPAGQGFWPAFWLLPSDGGWPPEIDVFEMLGADPTTLHVGAHETIDGRHVAGGDRFRIDTTQFHTYGVDWGPETLTFYVDGTAIFSRPTPETMNRPMYLLMNLAVGGAWGGAPDETTGVGEMRIDWVRAYATQHTVGGPFAPVSPPVPSKAGPSDEPVVCLALGAPAAATPTAVSSTPASQPDDFLPIGRWAFEDRPGADAPTSGWADHPAARLGDGFPEHWFAAGHDAGADLLSPGTAFADPAPPSAFPSDWDALLGG